MKKIIAFLSVVAIVSALAVPASAAVGGFDINKARPSINNAVTQIITAPGFNWSAWLSNLLEARK